MITRAVLRYVRISPRKFRLVIPLIKGKQVDEALAILMSVKKKGARLAIDVIKSAIANTKRIQGVEASDLYVSNLIASGGPMLKRFRAASMGRASPILKRTSHITVELDQMKKPEAAKSAEGKVKASKEAKEHKAKASVEAGPKVKGRWQKAKGKI